MEENSILLEMYENYLLYFKKSGYHPHPANLLAMLILPEKEKYEPLRVKDFNISDEEIKLFIETRDIITDSESFEHDLIWFVFSHGFGIMHGEMMYRPNQTDYEMYSAMDNKSKLYKMNNSVLLENEINNKVLELLKK